MAGFTARGSRNRSMRPTGLRPNGSPTRTCFLICSRKLLPAGPRRQRQHPAGFVQGMERRSPTRRVWKINTCPPGRRPALRFDGGFHPRKISGTASSTSRRSSERTKRQLHLGLEPEPLCLLENSGETISFFRPAARRASTRPAPGRASRRELRHLSLCRGI